MHSLIFGDTGGMYIDHINNCGRDNRKANLRLCSPAQNSYNTQVQSGSKSGYKGVSPLKSQSKKWRASIAHLGKSYTIGDFYCKHEAARAYNAKALELYGEFAWLNPVPDSPNP